VVVIQFSTAKAKAKDALALTELKNIQKKLEEYYANTGSYPNTALTSPLLGGIDASVLVDAAGATIAPTFSTGITPSNTDPTTTQQYYYHAYRCTSGTDSPAGGCPVFIDLNSSL
jgi:hypothetical protein